MKTKKSFSAPAPLAVATTAPATLEDDSLVIEFPENPSHGRKLDLTPWLGKGFDAWVWATAGQLRAFLASKSVTHSSVYSYWKAGMKSFFQYIEASGHKFEPHSLEPRHILGYIGWIKDHPNWAYGSQKNYYTNTKSVLSALVRRKIIPQQEDLFPDNVFPGILHSRTNRASPLSPSERQRLAQALRDDIIVIHKEQFTRNDSEAMVVYLLAVAIRTGANLTPLLEASRTCLKEHPFLPNMKLLELFKRRGNGTKLSSLRYSKTIESSLSIPMDGVALLTKALKLSEPLIAEAKPAHQDRVWLYRSRSTGKGRIAGEVTVLGSGSLERGIANFIERHDLKGDDGKRLKLNLSRLRKTKEVRLWELSGGDLIATAALMGHGPKVADTQYLACTQQMRENATFVGEAMPDVYRTGTAVKKVVPILPGKSPTGRCKDPYDGDKAPKNGEPCDNFFSCFACKSYAIVGSPEDLHRLFSFYWFPNREMNHARTQDWREEFRNTMNLIDRFTADQFDAKLVADAKAHAKVVPLKFWASYTLSSPEVVNG